jgi:hypothetical protein
VTAASAAHFAIFVLPFCLVVGGATLWLISDARSVRVPIAAADGRVRHQSRQLESTLVGGPLLVVAAARAFWWLLQVDGGRADLYMYRLIASFARVHAILGTIVVADGLLCR